MEGGGGGFGAINRMKCGGRGGGNFHLRTQVLYYSGFVTYQFQFHVPLTYLMVFRPPPTFQLLHCLSQNISNMTTGRKRFYPPTPYSLTSSWNGMEFLPFYTNLYVYYFIMTSLIVTAFYKLNSHWKIGKWVSEERVEFVFYFKPISLQSLPLAFTCLGNLLALCVKYVAWLHGWSATDYSESLSSSCCFSFYSGKHTSLYILRL